MRWRLWLGVLVSLAFLGLALRGVNLGHVGQTLGQVRVAWLLPVLGTIVARFWLIALRWQVLLRTTRPVGLHRLFGVTMIGFMANNVLPARIGELVRAYALSKAESLPVSLSLATIVLERVFDGFTLLLFLAGGLAFLRAEPWLIRSAVAAFCLYFAVLVGLLWLRGGGARNPFESVLARLPERVRARGKGLLESFTLGLEVLGDWRGLLATIALSLVIWLVTAAGVYAAFAAVALDLPPYAAFVVLAVIAVALMLPSAPGYVGTFHLGGLAGLGLFAVPPDTALSFSIVYHAVNYIPVTLAGLAYLGVMNLTLGELQAAGEQAS